MKIDKGTVWMEPRFRDISPDVHHPAWTAGTPTLLSDGRMLLPYSGPQSAHSPVGTTRVFCRITDDLGETWGPEPEVTYHPECNACGPCAFTARDGTIRVLHMGFCASVWQDGEPDFERTRSDLWCVESRDVAFLARQTPSSPRRPLKNEPWHTEDASVYRWLAVARRGRLVVNIQLGFDFPQTVPESAAVSNLNREPGPCVRFQNERALTGVQDQVNPQISKPDGAAEPGGGIAGLRPVRNGYSLEGDVPVGMEVHRAIPPDPAQSLAGIQVHAHAHSPLMKIRTSFGGPRGQTNHRRNRDATVHENSNIGCAADGQPYKDRVGFDALLQYGFVRVSTQRVEPGQDAGQMVSDFCYRLWCPPGTLEVTSTQLFQYQNAAPSGTTGRLDDELPVIPDDLRKCSYVPEAVHEGVRFRNRDALCLAYLLCQCLVVHERIRRTGIKSEDEVHVSTIDAKDAGAP